MEPPAYIQNHELVTNFYGRWPSFHDAIVTTYEAPSNECNSLSFTLHAWSMTRELDSKGYFILKDHALIKFRFDGLIDIEMDDFKDENILFGVSFEPRYTDGSFKVELDSVMDMSGSFWANSGSVVSLIPCTANGKTA